MLDRADCADFGCHNSIRLETKHFLNTLALTFISFSGRFVFAMQKHYLFFCERSSSSACVFVQHLCEPYYEFLGFAQREITVFEKNFIPQPLRTVGVLFSLMVSGWVVGKSMSGLYFRNPQVEDIDTW